MKEVVAKEEDVEEILVYEEELEQSYLLLWTVVTVRLQHWENKGVLKKKTRQHWKIMELSLRLLYL